MRDRHAKRYKKEIKIMDLDTSNDENIIDKNSKKLKLIEIFSATFFLMKICLLIISYGLLATYFPNYCIVEGICIGIIGILIGI